MSARLLERLEAFLKIPPQPGAPPGDGGSAVIFRAAPAFLSYRRVAYAAGQVPATLFLVAMTSGFFFVGTLAGGRGGAFFALLGLAIISFFILQAVVGWFCLVIDYNYRWYVLTDRSLRVREGALLVREMTVTFANIQNISVEQGPLQRHFGIADLKVDTAGGGGGGPRGQKQGYLNFHTAWLRGVSNAAEVRELMLRRLKEYRGAGLGDDRPEELPEAGNAGLAAVLQTLLAEARGLRGSAESLLRSA